MFIAKNDLCRCRCCHLQETNVLVTTPTQAKPYEGWLAVYSDGRSSLQHVRPLGKAVRKKGRSRAPNEAKVPTALRRGAGGTPSDN